MRIKALPFLLAIVAMVAPAWATRGPQSDVEKWLRAEWKRAATFPSLGEFGIKYRYETPVAPGTLEKLKAEIAGHPQHPGKAQAKLLEFAKDGFLAKRYCLFFESDSFWRVCEDAADGSFIDVAAAPGREWQLNPDSVRICNPEETAKNAPRTIHRVNVFRPMVGRLLLAGINLTVAANLEITEVKCNEDRWSMVAGRSEDLPAKQRITMRYEGTWNATEKRGFVTAVTFTEHGYNPEVVGSAERYSGWSNDNAAKQWIAGKVDIFKASGELERRIIFEEFVPMPEGGLDAITRIPSVEKPDPIRSTASYTSVVDFRTNTVNETNAAGKPTTRMIRTGSQPQEAGTSWLRPLGWGICITIIGTLIYLRTRRSAA